MASSLSFIVHSIKEDGLPSIDKLGQVMFVANDQMMPGWPYSSNGSVWVSEAQGSRWQMFTQVKQWVEFDSKVWTFLGWQAQQIAESFLPASYRRPPPGAL